MGAEKYPLELIHAEGCGGNVAITHLWPTAANDLAIAGECKKCSVRVHFEIPLFDFLDRFGPLKPVARAAPQLSLPLNPGSGGFSDDDAAYLRKNRISLNDQKQKAES